MFFVAANLVAVAAFPVTLPAIALVTVKFVKVPTDVKDEPVTVLFKDVPVKVPAAAVTVMSDEPSNATPLMFFVAANLVAVAAFPVTFPVRFAVIVPALKLPLASRATIADAVLSAVAVVAELLTFPLVAMVANLESEMDAEDEISSFAMVPSAIFALVMTPVAIDGDSAVPVKSPANLILPVADVVATGAPEVTLAST